MGGKRRRAVADGGQEHRPGGRSPLNRERGGGEEIGAKREISGVEGWNMGGDRG